MTSPDSSALTDANTDIASSPISSATLLPRWDTRLEILVLFVLIAIQLIPIWTLKYFPTTDGPSHVANADVIRSYFRPAGAMYRTYYELQIKPMSNMLGHYILASLLLVAPPLLAEKILLTLYVVFLPLAAYYACAGLRRGGGFLAIVVVPFAFGFLFHQGFYNFSLSTIFFFLLMGYWFRHREKLTLGRAAVLTLLSLLMFFCHLFALLMACAAIAVMTGFFTLADIFRGFRTRTLKWKSIWRGFVSRALVAAYALLPALLLLLTFDPGRRITGGAVIGGWRRPEVWKNLLSLHLLVAYRKWEIGCGIAMAVILAATVLWLIFRKFAARQWNAWDGLLVLSAGLVALYFKTSTPAAELLFIPHRLTLFAVFALLMWMAAQPFAVWHRRALWIAAAAIAVTLLVLRYPAYRFYNRQIAELVATADPIENNSTVLLIGFSPRGLPQPADFTMPSVAPFYMPAGYFAAAKHVVDLRNYEAAEQFFPVKFRAGVDPFAFQATKTPMDLLPAGFDILKNEAQMPTPVIYALVWGMPEPTRSDPRIQAMYQELHDGFDKIATSPDGATELWKRRPRQSSTQP